MFKNKGQNNLIITGDDLINNNHFYQNFTEDDEDYYNSTIKSPINKSIISMIDIEGDLLDNKKLFIDYNGLKNGLRNNKDGFVFFGTITHFQGKIINDFVLNIKDNNNEINDGGIFSKVFFAIFYDKVLGKFFFKNIKKINSENREKINFNLLTFIIQKDEIKIQNNMIIQFECSLNYYILIELKENTIELYMIRKIIDKIDENIFIFKKKRISYYYWRKWKIKNSRKEKIIFVNL